MRPSKTPCFLVVEWEQDGGMEERGRGRQRWIDQHEDKHRPTVRHFRDCQGRDARRQLHHVELPQVHVLEVIVGGTRSVKFVLKFFRSPHLESFFRTSRASIAITIVRNHH